jgi:RNA-binding protein
MSLTKNQKQQLRMLAHAIKPVVMIGNLGLTQAVQLEIHRALEDHELIKIKIAGGDKEQRKQITDAIIHEQAAHLIQSIGHVIVIYRQSQKIKVERT